MNCYVCGGLFPVGANYCPRCGTPQHPGAEMSAAGWELCVVRPKVVRSRLLGSSDWRLVAERFGPNVEQMVVGQSSIIKARIASNSREQDGPAGILAARPKEIGVALESLTEQLLREGWEQEESMHHVSSWHLRGFRRRVARSEA